MRPLALLGLLTLGAALLACSRWPSQARQAAPPDDPGLSLLQSEAARVVMAEAATTRLDVAQAADLLKGASGPRALLAKARLALYMSDCEGALSYLSGTALDGLPGAAELRALAGACHGATVGGVVHEDSERGIWIRVQDDADGVLVPLLMPVIDQARRSLGEQLGVDLPRPLRVELVRDLFSLAAVTGLPVEAAETTGTVAVAKWGKVTMLSPRATTGGYPWADTLAHELTHLMLTRASSDRAPLWLQEGVAKTLEERWRSERAFDGDPDPDGIAQSASASGQSVGVTKLGPSIALLPSAQAARIAFAEVSSFMKYWMRENGVRALPLLLRDMATTKNADSAMRSVSGLAVADWELLWRHDLSRRVAPAEAESALPPEMDSLSAPEVTRTLRLSELLYDAGYTEPSSDRARADLDFAPHVAALRYAAARGQTDRARRSEALGELSDIEAPLAEWLALRAALLRDGQSNAAAESMADQALALDPLERDVACAGWADGFAPDAGPELRALCDHVRSLPSPTAR